MKTSTFTLPFMVALITFGAEGPLRSVENLSADYADFLTNVTLQLNDAYVFEDSLDSFRKVDNYNSDAMLKALASIVNERSASTNDNDRHMARASINAMGYMQLTNALPMLRKWTLEGGELTSSSFNAFGEISGHDMSFLELAVCAINGKVLSESFVLGQFGTLMSLDNRIANGQELPQRYKLQEKVRLNMARLLINYENPSFESSMGNEEVFARCIGGYTNSIERVKAQQRINDFLIQRKEHILKKSACRTMGGNWKLSDEEWYQRATNNCQTEIARVMTLPEGERLNMTAILDAKIAAIEEAETRAARRAVWKRRLRSGTFIILPVLGIAFAILFVLKKKTTTPFTVHGCGKAGWCRTVESFVVVIVMIVVAGIVAFLDHRHQTQKTTTETPSPVATMTESAMTESAALEWLNARFEEFKREKERADAAVLNYRATNQLDFLKSQYESLKLTHDRLLLDLAKAESHETNEVATADLVSLREKESENARARAELQDRISEAESKLLALENACVLADANLAYILHHIEAVRCRMKEETMWE